MIISNKHKYIFIHCRKTAGSSISNVLSHTLGPWDIQLGAIEETLALGGCIPKRMKIAAYKNSYGRAAVAKYFNKYKYSRLMAYHAKHAFKRQLGPKPQHADAKIIKAEYPREWETYFKFCVVRNPYDLVISYYYWQIRNTVAPPTFERYLSALEAGDDLGGIVPVKYYSNWSQYTINDRVEVDKIIRYENLVDDLAQCLHHINIPFNGQLPHLKATQRKRLAGPADYESAYNENTKKIVERLHDQEINTFNYQF